MRYGMVRCSVQPILDPPLFDTWGLLKFKISLEYLQTEFAIAELLRYGRRLSPLERLSSQLRKMNEKVEL